jgi:DNA-binding SARP family transcriptional activator
VSGVALFMLGPPRVERDGVSVEISRRKVVALLAFLAATGKPHSREYLASLLWPEHDSHHAHSNFRRSLSILRKSIGNEWIDIDRENISLTHQRSLWTDIDQFQKLVAQGTRQENSDAGIRPDQVSFLAEAVELYQDDFLSGFYLRDCPGFDEWQFIQIESLRQEFASTLEKLVVASRIQGRFKPAIEYARRWLELDQLSESVHRQLMLLYSLDGQYSVALRQFEKCKSMVKDELGIQPEDETVELFETIRARRATSTAEHKPGSIEQISADDIRIATVLVTGMGTPEDEGENAQWDGEREDQLDVAVAGILSESQAHVDKALSREVIAIFGFPHVREDDAESALAASLQIRDAAKALHMRLAQGIATGTLIVRTRDTEGNVAFSATGTVIREASRLRHAAREDQILANGITHRRARGAFDFATTHVGGADLKGPVFKVTGSKSQPKKTYGIQGMKATLTGRGQEFQKLKVAMSEVDNGRGQFALITGDAGIGKSRLMSEFRAHVLSAYSRGSPPYWLEGRCRESGAKTSYLPFLELLYSLFAPLGGTTAGAILTLLKDLSGRGHLSEEQVEEIGPVLGNLLSVHFDDPWDTRLSSANPQEIQYRTFQALQELIVALSRQRPVILALEDLHWADALSLDLVSALMEPLVEGPILLLCACRLEWRTKSRRLPLLASRKYQDRYTELALRELNRQQCGELIESLLHPNAVSLQIKDQVTEISQGNPFFLEEAVRSLIDKNTIYQTGDTWLSRGAFKIDEVSEHILSITQDRMDSVLSTTRHVLQIAAVIGGIFEWKVLEEICSSETDLEKAVWALESHGFIFEERTVPERLFAFKHDLVRQAVYQTIPPSRLTAIHRLAGEAVVKVFSSEQQKHFARLAYHYERSDDRRSAVKFLLKAGEKARLAYSNEEAVGFYRRAIALMDGSEAVDTIQEMRLEALMGVVKVCELTGDYDEAEKCYHRAVAVCEELELSPRETAKTYLSFCYILYTRYRFDELMEHARKGMVLLVNDTECIEFLLMSLEIALAYGEKEDSEHWRSHIFRVERLLTKLPYSEELIWAYVQMAMAYASIKKESVALRWLADLRRKAQKIHDLRAVAASYANEGFWIYSANGDYRRAFAAFQQSLEIYQKIGDELNISLIDACTGRLRLSLGELDRAEECAGRALELGRKVGYPVSIALSNTIIGTVSLCRGTIEEAEKAYASSIRIGQTTGVAKLSADAIVQSGRAPLAQGKRLRARKRFIEAIRTVSQWESNLLSFAGAVSGLEEAIDDPDEYRSTCEKLQADLSSEDVSISRWFLEPDSPGHFPIQDFRERFAGRTSSGWVWLDPLEKCSYTAANGLEIRAVNGKDLLDMNMTAPRLMREVSGDFAVQTICYAASKGVPAIGGVLLWSDEDHYLRLDRGRWGNEDVCLGGCLDSIDCVIGRGNLRSTRTYLRLEKMGSNIRALCSRNGNDWYMAGSADFAESTRPHIGLFATGAIDRSIYHGEYTEGTAIHFEEFRIFRPAIASA